MKRKQLTAILAIALAAAALLCACGAKPAAQAEPAPAAEKRSSREIIEELVVDYGSYGAEAEGHIAALLTELKGTDADAAARWTDIMALWKTEGTAPELHYDILPDGLPDTDELAIVTLGFQLAPDGSMRDELIARLQTAKRCAEKYPNALVVCTGGGTAADDPSVTEAGKMAEWLIDNGVAAERVIVEDRSITTAQNAIFTFDILADRYPQVRQLAIVSSDYHIATGALLFDAEGILRGEAAGRPAMTVISNAAWRAPSGTLSPMFQAGALIELSGDTETAFAIYYDTYDIHPLPPLPAAEG